ncbi:MAG: site-specific DNA-methyltransferase [bacterium]
MPTLDWIGKQAVVNHDKDVPFRLLKRDPKLSVGDSQNLLIKGDNLEALKALMPYYVGKVKCVYIDPPYNTGTEKWVYNDAVNSPEIRAWLGKVVGPEGDDLTRHDKWLCMMFPRLKLIRDLMADEGLLFISIDDNEQTLLKLLCDAVFGERNFMTTICVKMSHLSGVKMSHVGKKLPKLKEYALMYAKDKSRAETAPAYRRVKWDKAFDRYKSFLVVDENTPSDHRKWKAITLREALEQNGIDPNDDEERTIFCFDNTERIFRTARNRSEQFTSLPKDQQFRLITTARGLEKYAYNREEVVFAAAKFRADEEGGESSPLEPLGDLWTDIGINNLHNEGGVGFRNGKKPLTLVKRIISICSDKNAIVLDSFAGSGTTGEAVLQLNKQEHTQRKVILIEMEKDIAENLTAKRMNNAIHGYVAGKSKVEPTGGGFQFMRLDTTLFDKDGNISEPVTYLDLARYIFFTETQKDLDEKKVKKPYIGTDKEKDYCLFFTECGKNIFTRESMKRLPKNDAPKVVYADRCLLSEETLRAHRIVFKQIPYQVKTY